MPYPERLKRLELPSLTYRRKRGDMIQTYKILEGKVDTENYQPLKIAEQGRTRGYSRKLAKRYSRTALRAHSFANRVVDSWNELPEDLVTAPSLNAFKNRLDRFWRNSLYQCRDH